MFNVCFTIQASVLNNMSIQQAHDGLLGNSLPMQALRVQIRRLPDSPFPVLIEGESGSGKDLVARHCHYASKRLSHPYLSINCAAISPLLAESILFGHAKGAFTGAVNAHSGYFEDAGEGTLFLDEIGELPLELQAKLLRVLENGEYQRIGETKMRASRARIVAATNRDLRSDVRVGKFRADLYHRLSVFAVHMPTLREMGEDKHLLREHFTDMYADQIGQAPFLLETAAQMSWLDYSFPGNVRELRNIVIRLIFKHAGKTLSMNTLIAEFDLSESASLFEALNTPSNYSNEATMARQAQRHLQGQAKVSLNVILKNWEKAYIEAAMQITNGNLSQAAKLLNLNRTTLYSRMNIAVAY